ncbi:GNAT family N-acetyltransferase [Vibrio splendidus]|uniref:GNAT family N-acetyltransferase n=1 Tax=Vibrio splendidus TaxID=29497 RepID=UPI000C81630A|nr:GNAT family N-acetyltransferase [Vibrio splendidus]MDH5917488.1 GNAT family N-acetyltransferase [Vibrio splendidus]PMH71308.1 GNAT family N-acetyltransferase [Vibrio splendidus]PMJ31949.1 GNAT family N-acetyltransferase [Vibrio splendidus]
MDMVKAALSHSTAFHHYVNACVEDGLDIYTGISDGSDAYLERRIAYSKGGGLPEGWTPASTYFCFESGRILGVIRVRHGTSPYIHDDIGHIGYETLPQARGRGIASHMLSWVQRHVLSESAIITCERGNIASQKVIEKCGGRFLNTFYSEQDKHEVLRYQLEPK